jgi:hypothetical protein
MPAQVRILQHILGVGTRTEHAVGDAEQPQAVALEFAQTILFWVHARNPDATSSP